MEVENESNNILTNEEKKICRMFTNSSLDIFQGNNEYCFRIEKSNQTFDNSYEHRVIQDNSANILQSTSNLLFYTMGNAFDNVNISKQRLKKYFYDTEQNKIMNMSQKQINEKYEQIERKLIREQIKNNPSYIQLDTLMNRENFVDLLRNSREFSLTIINHQFFPFHPRYEEVLRLLESFNRNEN